MREFVRLVKQIYTREHPVFVRQTSPFVWALTRPVGGSVVRVTAAEEPQIRVPSKKVPRAAQAAPRRSA